MLGLNVKITFLAPAYPSCGRTTENGNVFINGVKLTDTEYFEDPRTPVKDSRIAGVIGTQSRRTCEEIDSGFFEKYGENGTSLIIDKIQKGSEIIIFDCLTETTLEDIARMIGRFNAMPFLVAGSAGLAGHLNYSSLFWPVPVFFVFSGSVTDISLKQIHHAESKGNCRVILLDALGLLDNKIISDDLVSSVNVSVSEGIRRFIFCTALSRSDVEKVFRSAEQRSLSRSLVAEKIAESLGRVAAGLIRRFDPAGVLLTGGETAFRTVNALNAAGLSVEMEILPGIQCGKLRGCDVNSFIATKSGGFGGIDAIAKTFEFFKI